MDHSVRRRLRLARQLKADGLQAYLVTDPHNVTYLTGFSGDSSYLVLGRDRAVLVSDARFTQQIAEECPALETHTRPHNQTVQSAAAGVIGKLGYRAVGFESPHVS